MASLVLVGSVFWAGAFDGVGFEEKGVLWNWSGLPTATSLYTFCYCGHAVFTTLCNSMKDRTQFPKVCYASSGCEIVNFHWSLFGRNLNEKQKEVPQEGTHRDAPFGWM